MESRISPFTANLQMAYQGSPKSEKERNWPKFSLEFSADLNNLDTDTKNLRFGVQHVKGDQPTTQASGTGSRSNFNVVPPPATNVVSFPFSLQMPNVQMPFGGSMQQTTGSLLPSMNQLGNLTVAGQKGDYSQGLSAAPMNGQVPEHGHKISVVGHRSASQQMPVSAACNGRNGMGISVATQQNQQQQVMNQNWERGQQQEQFNDLVSAIHQMLFTQEQSQLANVTMPEFQRNGPLEKDKLSSDPYIAVPQIACNTLDNIFNGQEVGQTQRTLVRAKRDVDTENIQTRGRISLQLIDYGIQVDNNRTTLNNQLTDLKRYRTRQRGETDRAWIGHATVQCHENSRCTIEMIRSNMEIELGRQRQQIAQDRAQTELGIERERSERKRADVIAQNAFQQQQFWAGLGTAPFQSYPYIRAPQIRPTTTNYLTSTSMQQPSYFPPPQTAFNPPIPTVPNHQSTVGVQPSAPPYRQN